MELEPKRIWPKLVISENKVVRFLVTHFNKRVIDAKFNVVDFFVAVDDDGAPVEALIKWLDSGAILYKASI